MSALSAFFIGAGMTAWLTAAHERRHRPLVLVKRGYLETFERIN